MPRFQTTNWSLVLAARDAPTAAARVALESLCESYWYPLYACVRASGHDAETSRDLTQEFFSRLLARDFLDGVRPEAGRFRSFLLANLKHFLSHERDRSRALKRGGGVAHLSLDTEVAEDRFAAERAGDLTPEQVFERRWALTVLENALERLRLEYGARGEDGRFAALGQFLTGEEPRVSYHAVAGELGLSENAVKAAVHRLRRRLGHLLREEIAATVEGAAEVDEEVRYLLRTLGRPGASSP